MSSAVVDRRDILGQIRDDLGKLESYDNLRQAHFATGRGRRKKISHVHVDNKLLLQVFFLKEEKNKSWKKTEEILCDLLKRPDIPSNRMRTITEAIVKRSGRLSLSQVPAFLDEQVDIDGIGLHLTRAGFSRKALLGCDFDIRDSMPSNGIMVELGRFQTRNSLSKDHLLKLFCKLTQVTEQLPPSAAVSFRKAVDTATLKFQKLQTLKDPPALDTFVNSPFVIPVMLDLNQLNQEPSTSSVISTSPVVSTSSVISTSSVVSTSSLISTSSVISKQEKGGLQTQIGALRRKVETSEHEVQVLKEQATVLKEEKHKCRADEQRTASANETLTQQLLIAKGVTENLSTETKSLTSDISKKDVLLKSLKKENVARKNTRLLLSMKCTKKTILSLQKEVHKSQQKKRQLSIEKTKLERLLNTKKREQHIITKRNRELLCENRILKQLNEELERQTERKIIRLKDPKTGYFNDDAKVCVMQLVGENEISAGRCGKVIQTICRTLFKAEVPESDLPSERSVGRFIDMGQVLGKMQVASALTVSQHFDMHADGTSKVGKHIVGQQITTDDGQTLSCGYSVVGTENADCLVNLATELLEELAVVYEDDINKQQELFLEFFQKLSGVMSDRAAVMKCFHKRFNTLRKDLLQTHEDLQFLYCNAHVLLGFASAVVKAFKATTGDETVGRDALPKFAKSSRGEHPATRYVREACSVLGPRGDERYGCRESWLAFCLMLDQPSHITSFKANRFNNLFEASAALHFFHQVDIATFLNTCMNELNWKQEGLLLDSQSDIIDHHLVALGLFFFRMTGPYWCLLGKDVHHLDFYKHVNDMKEFLERWLLEPDDAFSDDFDGLFGINMQMMHLNNNHIFRALISISEERKLAVKKILKALASGFLTVIRSQLKDFLEEGTYHAVDDAELGQKLDHSKLTNLVGEQAFGDLDFSMFKRRHASAHYHSSMNILKRNKTIPGWFLTLSPQDQSAALVRAALKHQQLRKQKRQAEFQALTERRLLLEENRRKKAVLEEKKRQKKIDIIERLKSHKGPCVSAADIQTLLGTYLTQGEKRLAIQAELQYHRLILQRKSPHLRVTGKVPQLLRNLREFLGLEPEPEPEDEEVADAVPVRKRRRIDQDSTDSFSDSSDTGCEAEEGEEEGEDTEDAPDPSMLSNILDLTFTFKDVNPGTFIAVGYEDDFYIGEVEENLGDSQAMVNFMCRCNGKTTVYKWPPSADRCNVHEKFVVASDFEMHTTNGRFWNVTQDDAKMIQAKFRAYSTLYFY